MLPLLDEDQAFFRDTTARFLDEFAPADEMRRLRGDPAGFDRDYWRRGAELGWTSFLVAEEHGGGSISGQGAVDLTLVAHEFGRHAAPGPLSATNVVAGPSATRAAPTPTSWPASSPASWSPPGATANRRRPTRWERSG